MRTLTFRLVAAHGAFFLLLILAVGVGTCTSHSVSSASSGEFCSDTFAGGASGPVGAGGFGGGGAGGGGSGNPPPMDVCPTGPLPSTPCSPSACNTGSLCLSSLDQSSATVFGLRMAQLTLELPTALTEGATAQVLSSAMLPALPTCNVDGTGTFSWLLRFDTGAGTLTTGGARPVADPSAGYAFDEETIVADATTSFQVAPVLLTSTVTPECAFASTAADVVMPAFLDPMGATSLLLPLHQVTFTNGRVSADNGCIGEYNASGLDPQNACQPDGMTPAFLDGANVSAFITLEEADHVIVTALSESLCVLLSGDPSTFGAPSGTVLRCTRAASGDILFKGDWCAATNEKATPGCEDAMRFSGAFAAIGVKIL
jgi:hypothetical protein